MKERERDKHRDRERERDSYRYLWIDIDIQQENRKEVVRQSERYIDIQIGEEIQRGNNCRKRKK